MISRRWALFLIGVGVWTWLIWPRFGLAIWDDSRAFRHGSPTAFLWVHAVLIVASLTIGTVVGVLGVRAWRAGQAKARGVPAYVVLDDATIGQVAAVRPRTEAALARVRGIGPKRVEMYGAEILELIRAQD